MTPFLEIKQLQRRFGTLKVLHNTNLSIHKQEIVGLVGLSGSGKSVLAQILAGLYPPSSGDIYLHGKKVTFPIQAHQHKIDVIHQYPLLVESLSVTNNIYLGCEITMPLLFGRWLHVPHQAKMEKEAQRLLSEWGLQLDDMTQKVINLSSEQRQIISIVRTMIRPTALIVVDEPTGLLSYAQQQKLLSLIQYWRQQGKTIIFNSTNLDHLFAVTDRLIVLRDGTTVASYRTDEASREEVVASMVGQPDQERLTPVIWALDSYFAARETADHLLQEATQLEQNLVARDTLNQQLLETLGVQVKALDQANTALQNAQRRLLVEREQERKHLARELHDQVIQDLLSINYELETIEAPLALDDTYNGELKMIRTDIRGLVEDIRRICGNLRPPTIDSLGLSAAIQSYTKAWSLRTGIVVMLTMDDSLARLPEATELSIFRIIQESLSNIHRHADATEVWVELKHTTPRTLMFTIADNGDGLTHEKTDLRQLQSKGHYGLVGISERVALLGGHLRLQNRADGGFMIEVEVPHPRVETDIQFPLTN